MEEGKGNRDRTLEETVNEEKKRETQPYDLSLLLTSCSCQQYKSFHCCHLNVTLCSLYCCALLATITYLTQNVRQFCPILTKRGNSGQIFVEGLHIKFDNNPPSGSRADTRGTKDRRTDGWTNGSDEAKTRCRTANGLPYFPASNVKLFSRKWAYKFVVNLST